MEGGVSKTGTGDINRVIDSQTNTPIAGAKVTLPKQNFSTYTDNNGAFELKILLFWQLKKKDIVPFRLRLMKNLQLNHLF